MYFFHSVMNHFIVLEIITKFTGKGCRQIVWSFFFNCDSPKNFHFRSVFLNLDELIDRVGCCELNSSFSGPYKVFFVFNRIGVDDVIKANTGTEAGLNFLFWSAVHSSALFGQILDELCGGIGFDSIVGLNPGKSFLPWGELVWSFDGVVNEHTRAEGIFCHEWWDFKLLVDIQEPGVISLEEINRVIEVNSFLDNGSPKLTHTQRLQSLLKNKILYEENQRSEFNLFK